MTSPPARHTPPGRGSYQRTAPEMPKAGAATPAQAKQTAGRSADLRVSAGSDSPPAGIADVQVITGHRVRIPVPLLISRLHGPLALAVYGLVDMFTPRRAGARPYAAHRDTMAARLGVSVRALADAIRALSATHDGDGLGEAHPAYLTTRRRGYNLTAERAVTPVVPFVEVPAWTLGDASGPLVDWTAWRLYAALVLKRLPDGTCRLPAGELAGLIGVRRQSIPALLGRLAEAGMVAVVRSTGRTSVVLPLLAQVPDEQRAELAEQLAVACGYAPSTWSSDRLSPGPQTASRGGPQAAHLREETQLVETHRGDTGGAPPRALAPTGLTAAPQLDSSPAVEVEPPVVADTEAVKPEIEPSGNASECPGAGLDAFRAARAALGARNASRRAAEQAAAVEREKRLSALVADSSGVAA